MARLVDNVTIGYKTDGRLFVSVLVDGVRHRYSNGKCIGHQIEPNKFEGDERVEEGKALKSAFVLALRSGWRPPTKHKGPVLDQMDGVIELMNHSIQTKLNSDYSYNYKKDLVSLGKFFEKFLRDGGKKDLKLKDLTKGLVVEFINSRPVSSRTKRNYKAHLSAVLKPHFEERNLKNPFQSIKLPRSVEVLHKPIRDARGLLNELYGYDKGLHLCCILAYGCLLRPHREIRELTWGDFSEDLSTIYLSGSRNKGKRNRIVPVPDYVKPFIQEFKSEESARQNNIFSGTRFPHNTYFFATKWSRFKKISKLLEKDQTMYSFRHSGALKVFEQTGSLVKLQQVMGHSSLQVSLTYLRGLEVKQLRVEDMPDL